MALRLRDSVLPNLVKERLVADLQERSSLLAIPIRLFERAGNRFGFSFILGVAGKRLETSRWFCGVAWRGIEMRRRFVLRIQFGDGDAFVPENQVSLDEVAQFTQIARPRVVEAGLH